MPKNRHSEIRCYDYVNHSYEQVRDVLRQDALAVFQRATKSAVSRAQPVAAELHVDFGGIGVKADVKVNIKNIEERLDSVSSPATRLSVQWEAATTPRLFPVMDGELSIYPLTATETQLDFLGHYKPPFGAAGKAIDAMVGYRIAELSVHHFVTDVAEYLRRTLSK